MGELKYYSVTLLLGNMEEEKYLSLYVQDYSYSGAVETAEQFCKAIWIGTHYSAITLEHTYVVNTDHRPKVKVRSVTESLCEITGEPMLVWDKRYKNPEEWL